jgi:uncharacterized short protein YbdD (DUF466 family)
MKIWPDALKIVWQKIRELSGDDAYERYLKHFAQHELENPSGQPPLSKEAFYKNWQDKKWKGIKRCC